MKLGAFNKIMVFWHQMIKYNPLDSYIKIFFQALICLE